MNIIVKARNLSEAKQVHRNIPEFGDESYLDSLEKRCNSKPFLVVAYCEEKPAGYMIAYNRHNDGSLYCWMSGVKPHFRKTGVYSEMAKSREAWARKQGYNKLKIKTWNKRREMLSYLVNNGWNFYDIQVTQDINETRLLLEKKL